MTKTRRLTLELAENISNRKLKSLYSEMHSFTEVDVDAVANLAPRLCELRLDGLQELSDDLAFALTEHDLEISLNGLEELSDTAAIALSRGTMDLVLNGLKILSFAAAKSLSIRQSPISLDGLNELTDEVAAELAKHMHELSLRGLTQFPDLPGHLALARKLTENETLELWELMNLPDRVASILGQRVGELGLRVENLSNNIAEALSHHRGRLSLGSVRSLSPLAAASLSKHDGGLDISNLEIISDEVIVALASYSGNLRLGLQRLSESGADALAKHRGKLRIDGLGDASEKVVGILAARDDFCELQLDHLTDTPGHFAYIERLLKQCSPDFIAVHESINIEEVLRCDWHRVELDSVKSITCKAADLLSKHSGSLRLYGLTELSPTTAAQFKNHQAWLRIDGLKQISDATAFELCQRQYGVTLNGLTSISDATAMLFAQSSMVWEICCGLTNFPDTPGHVAMAKKLVEQYVRYDINFEQLVTLSAAVASEFAKTRNGVDLPALDALPTDVAFALSTCKGSLSLDGLLSLSDESSVALSKYYGESLSLNGLETLSDAAAEAIAKRRGKLSLDGLQSLTDSAAKSLSRHHGLLSLKGLENISEQGAIMLSKHRPFVTTHALLFSHPKLDKLITQKSRRN
ncbi:MAG: hypothetical protein SGI77_21455 [Pirellulaceae bacterium]|nr:hypothetical protein [Pirellulaceae bacterium]